MRLLRRYYITGFLRLLFIISFGLSSIMSLLDLVEKLDELMPQGVSLPKMILYAIYSMPKYFAYVMPLASLVSGLYTIGQASRRREIVAVMASGGRVKRLLSPFIAIGVLLSIFGFALNEFVVPEFATSAKRIRRAIKPTGSFARGGTIWLRTKDGAIVKFGLYLPEKDTAKNVSVFSFSHDGLKERIEAETAQYKAGTWYLTNAVLYDIKSAEVLRTRSIAFPNIEPPGFIEADVRSPDEMGIAELMSYVQKLETAGLRNPKLAVDLQAKVSYPLINLFMLVIGVSFSVRRGLGGLLASAVGILISLLYWLGFTMSLSLGYAGILPPAIAAWILPALFSVVAVYLFWTVPE